MEKDAHSDEEIIEILNLKKVAVIGMSKHQEKAAHFVPKYLSENGFDITKFLAKITIQNTGIV